ncbi:MAG: outer membrane protein assembly factor BamC [Gammaproteobacteria bacterium]|nr:outer membrane protein assembly factor BamC [Gammaproteobacteria bacterium]
MSMYRNSMMMAFGLLVLVACSSDGEERPEYLDSHTLNGLKIPPRLTKPDTRAELKIPEPSAKALEQLKTQENAKGTVAPAFNKVEFKSDNGLFWVEIHESADNLWTNLRDFWAHEGIKLARDEPLLGIMETEWLNEFKASNLKGESNSWFSSLLSPDVKDRFRMRVERTQRDDLSRIYVSHRGLEIAVNTSDSSTVWMHRQPDQVLEQEILLRLVLFTGLSKAKAVDMFDSYQAYHPRIRQLSEDKSRYAIIGRKDFVWHRLVQALDRLGVEIKQKDQKLGRLDVLVGELKNAPIKAEEVDEIAESSWLMSMLSGSDEKLNEKGQVEVSLQLQASSRETVMELKQSNNKPVIGGLAGKFRDNLVRLLK